MMVYITVFFLYEIAAYKWKLLSLNQQIATVFFSFSWKLKALHSKWKGKKNLSQHLNSKPVQHQCNMGTVPNILLNGPYKSLETNYFLDSSCWSFTNAPVHCICTNIPKADLQQITF